MVGAITVWQWEHHQEMFPIGAWGFAPFLVLLYSGFFPTNNLRSLPRRANLPTVR